MLNRKRLAVHCIGQQRLRVACIIDPEAAVRSASSRWPEMKSECRWVSMTCSIRTPLRARCFDVYLDVTLRVDDSGRCTGSDEVGRMGEATEVETLDLNRFHAPSCVEASISECSLMRTLTRTSSFR